MLYLADKRNNKRNNTTQSFMAFTNQSNAELFVNGISQGKAKADAYSIVKWNNVKLKDGENEIKVVSKKGKQILTDSFQCVVKQ